MLGGRDGEPVLRYGELSAADATGRALEARFELNAGRVRIVVESEGATYPRNCSQFPRSVV